VIAQIQQKPWLGWGRQAMLRTGTVRFLYETLNEEFGHPHNAYLEALLDNGIVGTAIILAMFVMFLFHAFRLFLEKRSKLCMAAGGIAAALILALLVAAMGSQSFYPVEGTVEMWSAIGLMLAVSVERKRALARANLVLLPGAAKAWSQKKEIVDLDAFMWPGDPEGAPLSARAAIPAVNPAFNPAFNVRQTVPASWRKQMPQPRSSSPSVRFRF
jgi:hypothetical protein